MSLLLGSKGYDVVLVARRRDRLEELAEELASQCNVTGVPLVADLTDPQAPADIVAELAALERTIDFLVNNAGYSHGGRYDEHPWDDHERHLRVMGIAPLELTHRLLPPMVQRGWGRVINVASIAGIFSGTPNEAVYGGSKAMVQRFSESIDAEFRRSGIRCTASIPGFTDTEIFEKNGLAERIDTNPLFQAAMMSPGKVAEQAYAAVMAGRPLVIHGLHHRVLAAVLLHAPLPVRRRLSNKLSSGVGDL
jgi:short-subunit dehydrogenase